MVDHNLTITTQYGSVNGYNKERFRLQRTWLMKGEIVDFHRHTATNIHGIL